MSGTSDKGRSIYEAGLRDQHAVERQAIELLERQLGRLENYPDLSARMREHLRESEEQAKRLEDLLAELGTSRSVMKDTGLAFTGNMLALAHTTAPDEVVKNTFVNFAFEHFEIAAYTALLALADAVGHASAAPVLQQSLREEQAMASWIADHIAPTTLRYLSRSVAGETAGI